MIGVLVNCATVILGSLIGLLFKKAIPERLSDTAMKGIGLCNIYIAISGMLKGSNVLILIISVILGGLIGEAIDIDKGINTFASYVEKKFKKDTSSPIALGYVTGSLLFCTGAMTIVGSINSGILGDHSLIFAKSTLDFVSSMMLSVSLGIGVLLSFSFVFVFQGGLVLLATYLEPFLTEYVVNEMTLCGSVLIFALSLNLLGITKIKVANYLPAIILTPIIYHLSLYLM